MNDDFDAIRTLMETEGAASRLRLGLTGPDRRRELRDIARECLSRAMVSRREDVVYDMLEALRKLGAMRRPERLAMARMLLQHPRDPADSYLFVELYEANQTGAIHELTQPEQEELARRVEQIVSGSSPFEKAASKLLQNTG